MLIFFHDEQRGTNWRNCRLTTKYPEYQLGWDIIALAGLLILDFFHYKSPQIFCQIFHSLRLYSRPYVYYFCQIFHALPFFPTLSLFWSLEQVDTARPRDTRPRGVRTSEIHSF